jgi:hypothetical protein
VREPAAEPVPVRAQELREEGPPEQAAAERRPAEEEAEWLPAAAEMRPEPVAAVAAPTERTQRLAEQTCWTVAAEPEEDQEVP